MKCQAIEAYIFRSGTKLRRRLPGNCLLRASAQTQGRLRSKSLKLPLQHLNILLNSALPNWMHCKVSQLRRYNGHNCSRKTPAPSTQTYRSAPRISKSPMQFLFLKSKTTPHCLIECKWSLQRRRPHATPAPGTIPAPSTRTLHSTPRISKLLYKRISQRKQFHTA